MRILIAILTALLIVIALLGLGAGLFTVAAAADAARRDPLGFAVALVYGSIPFAIGTIALGAVAIVGAIQHASREQVMAINRGTEVAINEARLAEHHRGAAR